MKSTHRQARRGTRRLQPSWPCWQVCIPALPCVGSASPSVPATIALLLPQLHGQRCAPSCAGTRSLPPKHHSASCHHHFSLTWDLPFVAASLDGRHQHALLLQVNIIGQQGEVVIFAAGATGAAPRTLPLLLLLLPVDGRGGCGLVLVHYPEPLACRRFT